MKKTAVALILATLLLIAGCSEKDAPKTENAPAAVPAETETEKEPVAVESFAGSYAEKGYDEIDSYMLAEIDADTIHIYMYSATEETSLLYWAGTFEQPDGRAEYSFDSINNKDETSFALFASPDDTKTFTISGGEISFTGSMLGATKTFHLVKVESDNP